MAVKAPHWLKNVLSVRFRTVGLQTPKMTPVKLRLAMASMGQPETKVSTLCQELGITRQTLYRHISPDGQLRADGIKLLNRG